MKQGVIETHWLIFILLISLFPLLVFSETILNGEQWGTYSDDEYKVTGDIIIPKGKTMIIEAGAIVRFDQFTGIIVRGTLKCNSKYSIRTLLTSNTFQGSMESDTIEINFSQWNGIEVEVGGAIHFESVNVVNSVYGIKAHKQYSTIIMKNILFENNEQNFTIGDIMVPIENYREFNYPEIKKVSQAAKPTVQKDTVIIKEIPVIQTPAPIQIVQPVVQTKSKSWVNRRKTIVLISFGTLAATSGILCKTYTNKAKRHAGINSNVTDTTLTPSVITKAGENAEKYYLLRDIWGIVSAAGAACFSISFFF